MTGGLTLYVTAPWQGDVLSGTELRGVERCRSVNDGTVNYEVTVSVENDDLEHPDPVGASETVRIRTPDGVSRRSFDVVEPLDRIMWDSDGYRRCMYSLGY